MAKLLRLTGVFITAIVFLSLVLFALNETSLANTTAALNEANFTTNREAGETQPAKPAAAAVTDTLQNFDSPGTGTPYSVGIGITPTVYVPTIITGGPTNNGKLLRLTFGTSITNGNLITTPHHNSITFDRTASGTFGLIMADFDFRITPGKGRADGIGFGLLNTANHGITGIVTPTAVAEEPNFIGSLGIGFDVYRSAGEINNNHISIHFNGITQEFDATPAVNLASGEWVHAQIILRPGGGFSDVTVIVSPYGGAACVVVNQFKIPSFTPYEGRVHLAARSGGLTANHDIDNVQVRFLNLPQSFVAFNKGCYSEVETKGKVSITVTRAGNTNSTITVNYATTNSTAKAGSDYTKTSGKLTFNPGETVKTFSVPILDEANNEGDESFLVSLSNPTGGAKLGGPAIAKVTIVDDEARREKGQWSEVIHAQVVPIHMHLLPNGKVMYWDRHNHQEDWDGTPRLWDPATGIITPAATLDYDIFCSGHSFLADGRLLVTGGHFNNDVGEDEASIYNPFANSWTRLPVMNNGRWYPSNVTLANGDTLVMAGTFTTSTTTINVNTLPQVWQSASGIWRNLTTAKLDNLSSYPSTYPFLYLAPNGKVFNAGPQQIARYLDTSGTGQWTDVAASALPYRDYGSSVMYDADKVLIVGGNPRDPDLDHPTIPPSASAEVIDLNDTTPGWRQVAPISVGRRHLNATLLPDGKVLITGGSSLPGFDNSDGAVLYAEMWDPAANQWSKMASYSQYRGYHSTALLLPDGRVLVGGGGHPDSAAGPQNNFEIYSPPYLFKGPRPTISAAPSLVTYGQSFLIQTPNAASIAKVNLIRLSSVTHAFNQNQRINHLNFSQACDDLKVTVPADPNLSPPGYYMLFTLNNRGVPSVAKFIRVVPTLPNLPLKLYLPAISGTGCK